MTDVADQARNVCCMFDNINPDHAVVHGRKNLKFVKAFECDSSHRKAKLYRCRLCGGYVYYTCEETACWDWDNPDIFEDYSPVTVDIIEHGDDEPEYELHSIKGAKYIYGHNLELDAYRRYEYRD